MESSQQKGFVIHPDKTPPTKSVDEKNKTSKKVPIFFLNPKSKFTMSLYAFAAIATIIGTLIAITSLIQSNKPSPPPVTKGTIKSLDTIDWNNYTYPFVCSNLLPKGTSVTLKNGGTMVDNIVFEVKDARYGNITQPNQLDAIVPFECGYSDGPSGEKVFIFTGNASDPKLIGVLPSLEYTPSSLWDAKYINILGNYIDLSGTGSSPKAGKCCPDLNIDDSYKWDGHEFKLVEHDVSPITNGS